MDNPKGSGVERCCRQESLADDAADTATPTAQAPGGLRLNQGIPEADSFLLQPVALAWYGPPRYSGFRLPDRPAMRGMMAMGMTAETRAHKPKTQLCVYELGITLQEIRPPIWRLLQVPNTLPLKRLHDVLQTVIGWTDSHLHRFEKDGKHWGVPEEDEDYGAEIIDESRATIGAVLRAPGDSMLYVYDFGDNWRHNVELEKILPASEVVRPICLAGERHCPPEDVGGVSGYEEFLEVIFEPGHEEYEHYIRWAGGPSPLNRSLGRFQPEEFNVMAANDALSRMRWHGRHRQ